eukprot:CAMPEP_0198596902 /NCGR_PEP_ID=MMETSP1462-20131121/143779_1 /TAXON_ID=1333877 /ORGANISM="Brandtodinium nutriculum, Strain RCC3387" /LENGTH=74 /DNA_ID=CAMNT_0044328551 /DNA_START=58 /DNA_END=282 /DNA_ORIENTATION=-
MAQLHGSAAGAARHPTPASQPAGIVDIHRRASVPATLLGHLHGPKRGEGPPLRGRDLKSSAIGDRALARTRRVA